jgi:hypothetical protein
MKMSSTLTIQPANRKKNSLPTELKWILQKKFNGIIHNRLMDRSDLSYLEALKDSDIDGAEELINFIEKYEEVILNEDF